MPQQSAKNPASHTIPTSMIQEQQLPTISPLSYTPTVNYCFSQQPAAPQESAAGQNGILAIRLDANQHVCIVFVY